MGILKELPVVKTVATIWENRHHIKGPLSLAKVVAKGLASDWAGQLLLYASGAGAPVAMALTALSLGDFVGLLDTKSMKAEKKEKKQLDAQAQPQPA